MTRSALPESCSSLTPLFRGEMVVVEDWNCAGHDSHGRNEEWSREDRVVVTRRGVWDLEVEGDLRRADPMTATCWNGGRPYRVRHPIAGGDRCTVFRLTARGSNALREVMGSHPGPPGSGTFPVRSRPLDGPDYLLHRQTLERARRSETADPLAVEEPAFAFLRRVAEGNAVPAESPRKTQRHVDRARDIIARDFRTPLTVESIAREVECSPFHLSRLFRRATGMSLYRAVVRMRLREALERLLDEPGRLSRIALDAGFASHSHFTDAFRAEYGCPPSSARRGNV